jgi:SAM-dependent methyltransferase
VSRVWPWRLRAGRGNSQPAAPTLREYPLPRIDSAILLSVREQFEKHYLERLGRSTGKGLYRDDDWRRLQFAETLIPDGVSSILDVGVGPGAFLNYLALSGRFERVTGIDKVRYSRFLSLTPDLDYRIEDITATSFADGAFDVVFCMEVLEHLDDTTLELALSELRRITTRRLIMSVPFNEPLPLPSYHVQHFDEHRLRTMFPDATLALLRRGRWHQTAWPWAIVVEDR